MHDTVVFIGRFQPLHLGHEAVIRAALEKGKQVIVAVGSSFASRTTRNPFTFEERKHMLETVFCDEPRLKVVPIADYPYDDNKWVNAVRKQVAKHTKPTDSIALIGYAKDETSYYLNIFRDWDSINVPGHEKLNATDLRVELFSIVLEWELYNNELLCNGKTLSSRMISILDKLVVKPEFVQLSKEYALIQTYKEAWSVAPYEPTFHTVDALVVQSGHVLLVKRKAAPGIGLWALPGGFLNPKETTKDGALRELREETKIKVSQTILESSIKGKQVFDEPNRSTRGRTITTAFHFQLSDKFDFPKVKGSDDAEKAKWVPFERIRSQDMFEDHYHIIDYFLNIAGDA